MITIRGLHCTKQELIPKLIGPSNVQISYRPIHLSPTCKLPTINRSQLKYLRDADPLKPNIPSVSVSLSRLPPGHSPQVLQPIHNGPHTPLHYVNETVYPLSSANFQLLFRCQSPSIICPRLDQLSLILRGHPRSTSRYC